MKVLRTILLCSLSVLLFSCRAIGDFLHDGDVVAKVGQHKLYLTDLEAFIPNGTAPEDSTRLADQYIRSWAAEQLYLDMASEQLSKEEKDVSKELEAYKNSLLRYRYEQRYVNERLDTTVSRTDIEEYYDAHNDLFVLDIPILKARFLDIMEDSPNYETIRRRMSSNQYEDIVEADSLAYSSALRYVDWSDRWIDAVTMAREFGTDYGTMLSRLSGSYIEMREDRGDVKVAYVLETRRAGTLAPLEYCEDRIRNIIISNRKHELLATLEQDLLDNALSKENFIIYSEK
ncbi:MAG: hypothetical protein J5374_11260 [Bacteroidales bacterium]|nr:hypothetical protein [Bacteroidales bacterium]